MSAPDAWSPPRDPAPDEAPRPGMTPHRLRPELQADVKRRVLRAVARLCAPGVLLELVVFAPIVWSLRDDAWLAVPPLLAMNAVAFAVARFLYRHNLAMVSQSMFWSDDHGLAMRRPGHADVWVRRSEVAEVTKQADRVVVRRDDGLTVWFGPDLSDVDVLEARVTSWAPEHPAPPPPVPADRTRWIALGTIVVYVVHALSLNPWIVTITGVPLAVGLVWAASTLVRNDDLPPVTRLLGVLIVLPLASIVAKVAFVWILPLP
jgi:hypothetical protein